MKNLEPAAITLRVDGYENRHFIELEDQVAKYNDRVIASYCFVPQCLQTGDALIEYRNPYHPTTLTELCQEKELMVAQNQLLKVTGDRQISIIIPGRYLAQGIKTVDAFFYENALVIQRIHDTQGSAMWTLTFSFRPSTFTKKEQ